MGQLVMTLDEAFEGSEFYYSNWNRKREAWASHKFSSGKDNNITSWINKNKRSLPTSNEDRLEKIIPTTKAIDYLKNLADEV